jgi:hypothetical protein
MIGQDSLVSTVAGYGTDNRVQFLAVTDFSLFHHQANFASYWMSKELHQVSRLRIYAAVSSHSIIMSELHHTYHSDL